MRTFLSSFRFLVMSIMAAMLLFSCSQTMGASIEGPTQVQAGRLVKLTARVAADSKFAWFAFPPDQVDAVFVDKQFIFTANPGRYVVYLVEFPEGGGQSQTMSTVDVQPAPQPVPVPPQPGPAPSLPDGQFGLAKWAYAQAKLTNDSANAQSLAGEVRAIMSAVAAGTIKTPNDLQTSLRSSLDARGDKWAPFRKSLRDELIRLGMGSKPMGDWVVAFGEMATGLEAVR